MLRIVNINEEGKPVRNRQYHDEYYNWFEEFEIEGPLYHGSDRTNLDSLGIRAGSFMSESPGFAEMYGKVLYEINLPEGSILSIGEDADQFVNLKKIQPRWIKKIKG